MKSGIHSSWSEDMDAFFKEAIANEPFRIFYVDPPAAHSHAALNNVTPVAQVPPNLKPKEHYAKQDRKHVYQLLSHLPRSTVFPDRIKLLLQKLLDLKIKKKKLGNLLLSSRKKSLSPYYKSWSSISRTIANNESRLLTLLIRSHFDQNLSVPQIDPNNHNEDFEMNALKPHVDESAIRVKQNAQTFIPLFSLATDRKSTIQLNSPCSSEDDEEQESTEIEPLVVASPKNKKRSLSEYRKIMAKDHRP